MHLAFDGGCFQQSILGGIYQVACGFLNAAWQLRPDLQVVFVCDPRQGVVREAALSGLNRRPEIIYAPVARSYDEPELWPAVTDPAVRFFVDGKIIPAKVEGNIARYEGAVPRHSFAIVSRASRPIDSGESSETRRRGIRVEGVSIQSGADIVDIPGYDRRLSSGFLDSSGGARWTDGVGFIPLAFFSPADTTVIVDVTYTPQDEYAVQPGPGSEAILAARRARRNVVRSHELAELSSRLRSMGCRAYVANHFTPVVIPDMPNYAWAYDLIPILLPQYFHEDARLNFQENIKIFNAAACVYSISECTRRDLISHLSLPPQRVVTAGIAPSSGFSRQSDADIAQVLAPLGLRRNQYLIAVATIEPRKNHIRLLQAYEKLRSSIPDCPELILVGKMGWDFVSVLEYRSKQGLENVVKILSDRPEKDLACLYSGALLSVYISVYEGFGLPIAEAMACGCPVVTSDRSSMPEVAGNAARFVNPYAVDSISAGLLEVATNARLRETLVVEGRAQATKFTWEISAKRVLDDILTRV